MIHVIILRFCVWVSLARQLYIAFGLHASGRKQSKPAPTESPAACGGSDRTSIIGCFGDVYHRIQHKVTCYASQCWVFSLQRIIGELPQHQCQSPTETRFLADLRTWSLLGISAKVAIDFAQALLGFKPSDCTKPEVTARLAPRQQEDRSFGIRMLVSVVPAFWGVHVKLLRIKFQSSSCLGVSRETVWYSLWGISVQRTENWLVFPPQRAREKALPLWCSVYFAIAIFTCNSSWWTAFREAGFTANHTLA